nr:uncharacterized protein LOC128671682 isoform X1 [Plodia interpunctella]
MISAIISRLVILVFGTLYPAYASYKAVRTKNLKEYVKWMMYWIVFALFTCTETFTDVFLSWFPFYYEVKIVLVLWLLSPATKGSSILYRKFVHPALCRREQEIDEYIAKAKDQGYHTVLNLGTKGVNYATTVIMQTAIKGGGGLVQQLRKSYSLSDLTECEPREERGDEADDVLGETRLLRRPAKSGPRRSASESNSRSPMYFPEVDVDVRTNRSSRTDEPDLSHIRSSEDISSGYSSADNSASLTRAGSSGARARARSSRTTVTAIKRPQAAEDDEVIIEEPHDDDTFEYANMPPLVNIPSPLFLSHSDPPFLYQYVGDQIKIIQVLGDLPIGLNSNKNTTDTDQWEQIDAAPKTTTQRDSIEKENIKLNNVQKETKQDVEIIEATVLQTEDINSISSTVDIKVPEDSFIETHKDIKIQDDGKIVKDTVTLPDAQKHVKTLDDEKALEDIKTLEIDKETKKDFSSVKTERSEMPYNKVEESIETTSLETSINENDSAESDDEASFGTPDNSPKSKRKANKGKYGKAKAPPPPKIEKHDVGNDHINNIQDSAISTTSQESLTDIINRLPDNALQESTMSKSLQVVNPIAEKKWRHKAKSPVRIPKPQNSSIGKLLQLPSKLAFWQKSDDSRKIDAISTSSEDHSRRSSTIEQPANDEFQSCAELNKIISKVDYIEDDQISFKDAADFDSETISHDIIEKSDALQKLIEAKLESHPEYKFVPLHEDIPTTSKSTDV